MGDGRRPGKAAVDLGRELEHLGWEYVRLSGRGHPIYRYVPNGALMTIGGTSSDRRARHNAMTLARRLMREKRRVRE